MNETRRKPTTGTRCPTLFYKWHGIFYMPSCTGTAGHTKAFHYPVMDHWGKVKVLQHEADSNRPVDRSTVELTSHQTTMTTQGWRIKYTSGPKGGIYLPNGGGAVCDKSPATCRPSPGGPQIYSATNETCQSESKACDKLLSSLQHLKLKRIMKK